MSLKTSILLRHSIILIKYTSFNSWEATGESSTIRPYKISIIPCTTKNSRQQKLKLWLRLVLIWKLSWLVRKQVLLFLLRNQGKLQNRNHGTGEESQLHLYSTVHKVHKDWPPRCGLQKYPLHHHLNKRQDTARQRSNLKGWAYST